VKILTPGTDELIMSMSRLRCADLFVKIGWYNIPAPGNCYCASVRAVSTTEQLSGAFALSRVETAKERNMIKNVKQYQELSSLVEMAEENLSTLRFGAHYFLKMYLKKHFGLVTGDSRDTIKKARKLMDEFMTAYLAEDE
jgi:hypothetical protein